MPNSRPEGRQPDGNNPAEHNNHNHSNGNGAAPAPASNKSEFLQCLSDFFRRDLVAIPVVKKYPHAVVQQRCGLRAATLELDTAAHPNIEYVAGTRLSVYPANPAAHVTAVLEHLHDDLAGRREGVALPPNSAWWARFLALHKADSLRLALTHLFDIEVAPSRETVRLVVEGCLQGVQQRELRRKFGAVCSSNEAWEQWICSGHRSLKSLFDEIKAGGGGSMTKLSAVRLLAELDLQTPRQYSISNIKSSKRFRTEIIVFQHKFNLRQIELNLRQLKERESFDKSASASSPKSPSLRSHSGRSAGSPLPLAPAATSQRPRSGSATPPQAAAAAAAAATAAAGRGRGPSSGSARAAAAAAASAPVRNVAESSRRSGASVRSIRSLAPFATSPPISTHQVKRVPSFSGPLMSMYANATTTSSSSQAAQQQQQQQGRPEVSTSGPLDQAAAASKQERMRSRMSQIAVPEMNFSDPSAAAAASPSGAGQGAQAKSAGQAAAAAAAPLFDGLCSNYLLNLNTNDQIVCEFVENPRFTLKGNRERPIMMIGQDIGLIAFRPFWQQRNLEHDRAQVFYTLFKDLAPKKFGEMQLVCITGHKCRIEELLFRHEINMALTSKVLSSVTYINRKHLVSLLKAAHTKSQLVFAQYNSTAKSAASQASSMSQMQQQQQQLQQQPSRQSSSVGSGSGSNNLQITNKELLELGERMHKLLVEHTGCLYTCCDPHMTQAIEILLFESIAGRNSQLTRERMMQLLPKWKGKDTSGSSAESRSRSRSRSRRESTAEAGAILTLENTYERARIVQEIYDNTI